jgi:hypothetical protein
MIAILNFAFAKKDSQNQLAFGYKQLLLSCFSTRVAEKKTPGK